MQSIILIFMVTQLSYPSIFGISFNSIRSIHKEPKDETLIRGKLDIGLYGGPIVKFTELNDDFAILVGGRGGFVFNHSFVIGGEGYGLVNDIEFDDLPPLRDQLLAFGYGGVFFEYINRPHKIVHLSIHSLIGGGSLCYENYYYGYWYDDVFFIAEPGVDLMLNITDHFRMGIGGSYRFVTGVNSSGLRDADIRGPAGSLTFKFGHF